MYFSLFLSIRCLEIYLVLGGDYMLLKYIMYEVVSRDICNIWNMCSKIFIM